MARVKRISNNAHAAARSEKTPNVEKLRTAKKLSSDDSYDQVWDESAMARIEASSCGNPHKAFEYLSANIRTSDVASGNIDNLKKLIYYSTATPPNGDTTTAAASNDEPTVASTSTQPRQVRIHPLATTLRLDVVNLSWRRTDDAVAGFCEISIIIPRTRALPNERRKIWAKNSGPDGYVKKEVFTPYDREHPSHTKPETLMGRSLVHKLSDRVLGRMGEVECLVQWLIDGGRVWVDEMGELWTDDPGQSGKGRVEIEWPEEGSAEYEGYWEMRKERFGLG